MRKKILLTGNEAIVEGALAAGCKFYAGYPITPQNELIAYMSQKLPEAGGVFLQAESELAAINMVFGASAAGFRAMTSSSSPGISLKQEGISYLAASQLPAVIVNIMRGGPGLGNIAPSQSDYFQATKGGGHGDYHNIVLAPANVQECFTLTKLAFSLADIYRNPVMLLGDGLLGQMMEPLDIQNTKQDGKVQNYAKPWALTGCQARKPNIIRSLFLAEGVLEKVNLAIQKKYKQIQRKELRYEESLLSNRMDLLLVAYGTMSRIAKSAALTLRDKGIKAGLFRPISLWPFPKDKLKEISQRARKVLVVEMSYGQLLEDVLSALEKEEKVEFLGRAGGEFPSAKDIIKKAQEFLRK